MCIYVHVSSLPLTLVLVVVVVVAAKHSVWPALMVRPGSQLSHMAAPTLTELVYFAETTCTVSELSLFPEPVPCIIPTCGNIISQTACRQTGYCLRMAVNFSVREAHAMDMTMAVVQSSARARARPPCVPRGIEFLRHRHGIHARGPRLRPHAFSRRSDSHRRFVTFFQTRCPCWT